MRNVRAGVKVPRISGCFAIGCGAMLRRAKKEQKNLQISGTKRGMLRFSDAGKEFPPSS